jgi:hypothetical protein
VHAHASTPAWASRAHVALQVLCTWKARRLQLAQCPGAAHHRSQEVLKARLAAVRVGRGKRPRGPQDAGRWCQRAVQYGKSHQPGLCRARRISLIVFSNFHFMRIIMIMAIIEPFKQDQCSFICITCYVSVDAAYALSIAVLVSGNCVYVTHSSLCLSAQCAYITKAWYAWYVNIQQFTCCVSVSISNKISVSTVTRHERVTVHSACITDTVSVFTINRQIDW